MRSGVIAPFAVRDAALRAALTTNGIFEARSS
jgi:hypothetical protein